MSAPNVLVGQRAEIIAITRSKGALRPGMIESAEINPDLAQKKVSEIGNLLPPSLYNVHNGGTGKLSVTESNELAVFGMLSNMETAPSGVTPSALNLDVSRFQEFHVLLNKIKDADDSSFGGFFAYGCLASGISAPIPSGDATKRDVPFGFKKLFDIRGMRLRYLRCRATATLESTPGDPTSAEAAGGTFAANDVVYYRLALSSNANTAASPPPTSTEPLSMPTKEYADPVGVANNKVTVTFAAAVPAGKSMAVYVGRASGQEVFYGWVAAAGTLIDITGYPADLTGPRPPQQNTSGAFQATGDALFATVSGIPNSIDLVASGGPPAKYLQPSGLPYVAVMKNGVLQPEPHTIATKFFFNNVAGVGATIFSLSSTPETAQEEWTLILPVDPS